MGNNKSIDWISSSDILGEKRKFLSDVNKKIKAGTVWPAGTVKRFLTTPAVYGAHQPHRHEGNKKIRQGEPIENYYPPIIDKKTFWEVQDVMLKRTQNSGPRSGSRNLLMDFFFVNAVAIQCFTKEAAETGKMEAQKNINTCTVSNGLKLGTKNANQKKCLITKTLRML